MSEQFIPEQFKGTSADISSEKHFEDRQVAVSFYGTVKERLFNCSEWHNYAGKPFSDFTVYNQDGQRTTSPVGPQYYLAIDIPGPGKTEETLDWVQVQYIVEDYRDDHGLVSLFTVKPCSSPLTPASETHHFFGEDASSTFVVRLLNQTVYTEVHGRNEKVNHDEGGIWNNVRNWIVAITGMAGGTTLHWKRLTDGLLEPAEKL